MKSKLHNSLAYVNIYRTGNTQHIKTMCVQIEIKENQHNGRDTHIRQVQIFAPKDTKASSAMFPPVFMTSELSQYQTLR